MTYIASPTDSRYVPLNQSSYLCVPTCFQIVMYKNHIPLIPAEEIGYHLGLTVPPGDKHLFYNVRVSERPPVSSGYGTQIQTPEYEPNNALKNLAIPLSFSTELALSIHSVDELLMKLKDVEDKDLDALLCFNPGVLYHNKYEPETGHVVVFDRVINGKIRIVDPATKQPKWRIVEPSLLFEAIQAHGDQNSGGIWYLKPA